MSRFEVIFPGNKKIDVAFKNFKIKTDQSKKNKGDETAPEPFDVFISSLGACAGIYAKSFCDIRKLSTSNMHLSVDTFFKKGQKLIDRIRIILYVNQEFPEKYIKPIIKAMNGCAVKRQLHPDIKIDTAVAYMDQ
ncbi:MAG: osmotically inducible protein OsmC [Deltaproteobacteria bacterium]|nr:osmotically inducible protein OsmC [Deltaproteobacteria bacterium]